MFLFKLTMDVIFDSNVFDEFVNGTININIIEDNDINVFVTHIQIDELSKCSDIVKKTRLLSVMNEVGSTKVPTESFVFGRSKFGSAKLSSDGLYSNLRGDNPNHAGDALIGEVAIKKNLVLITNDKDFKNKVNKYGGKAISVVEFLDQL